LEWDPVVGFSEEGGETSRPVEIGYCLTSTRNKIPYHEVVSY